MFIREQNVHNPFAKNSPQNAEKQFLKTTELSGFEENLGSHKLQEVVWTVFYV